MRNLAVGVPFKEDVAGVHYRSMLRFQKRYPDIEVITSDGTRIDRQRNEIVRTFLALDREWLLQIDSDMEFYPEDVEDLMAGEGLIRTGLICNRERTPVLGERTGGDGTKTQDYRLLPKFAEPRTIDACGGAFLLVNREVYEKLDNGSDYPWFQFTDNLGEDWEFCRRAREVGYDIWAIPQANIGHRKGYTVRA